MIGNKGYISGFISSDSEKRRKLREQKLAEPKREVTVANVASYVTAEMSLQLYGPVGGKALEERRAQCMACPSRRTSSELADEIGFCSSCGCGVSDRSRLSVKITMPKATCPLGKWNESDGRHPRLIDRLRSAIARFMIGDGKS